MIAEILMKMAISLFAIQVMTVVMLVGSNRIVRTSRSVSQQERYMKRARFYQRLGMSLIWPVTLLLIAWFWVR